MRKIIVNSTSHNLNTVKFPKSLDFMCTTYATGKLIVRPSPLKIQVESLKFLERIQGDICGPIQPLSGLFRYFMVLIDASTRWSHVCLLSTHNHAFAKFSSIVVNDYCMAQGIKVQHSVSYVHTQNGLAKSLIKRIKLITRTLLYNCNLPITGWVMQFYTADLIQF
jgi:hypothetical protein